MLYGPDVTKFAVVPTGREHGVKAQFSYQKGLDTYDVHLLEGSVRKIIFLKTLSQDPQGPKIHGSDIKCEMWHILECHTPRLPQRESTVQRKWVFKINTCLNVKSQSEIPHVLQYFVQQNHEMFLRASQQLQDINNDEHQVERKAGFVYHGDKFHGFLGNIINISLDPLIVCPSHKDLSFDSLGIAVLNRNEILRCPKNAMSPSKRYKIKESTSSTQDSIGTDLSQKEDMGDKHWFSTGSAAVPVSSNGSLMFGGDDDDDAPAAGSGEGVGKNGRDSSLQRYPAGSTIRSSSGYGRRDLCIPYIGSRALSTSVHSEDDKRSSSDKKRRKALAGDSLAATVVPREDLNGADLSHQQQHIEQPEECSVKPLDFRFNNHYLQLQQQPQQEQQVSRSHNCHHPSRPQYPHHGYHASGTYGTGTEQAPKPKPVPVLAAGRKFGNVEVKIAYTGSHWIENEPLQFRLNFHVNESECCTSTTEEVETKLAQFQIIINSILCMPQSLGKHQLAFMEGIQSRNQFHFNLVSPFPPAQLTPVAEIP